MVRSTAVQFTIAGHQTVFTVIPLIARVIVATCAKAAAKAEAFAEAFVASRVGGESGRAFGTLPAGTDFGPIVSRATPELG